MKFKKYKSFVDFLFPVLKEEFGFERDIGQKLFSQSTKELFTLKPSEVMSILLGERFVLELLEEDLLPEELLKKILKEKKVKGLILKGDVEKLINAFKKRFMFFSLKGFVFVPYLNGSRVLLKEIFNLRGKVKGVEVELEAKDIDKNLELLIFNEIFGFDILFEKGLKGIEKFFGRLKLEEFKKINEIFTDFEEGIFIGSISEKIKPDFLKNFENIDIFDFGKGVILLTKEPIFKELENICKEYGLKAGVISRGVWEQYKIEGSTPILYMLGALEHAIRLRDKNVIMFEGFTYHVLGDLFFEWGDMSKAWKYYELGSAYTKQPVELALSRAAICYELGEYSEAESLLKGALCECKGKDPAVYYNLGLLYFKQGLYDKAVEQFYKAYLLSPEDLIFREALVSTLWKLRRYEEIKELLEDKEDLSFKEMRILGKVYFKEENFHKAYEFLKKGITGEPDAEAIIYLAWIYLYINKESQAGRILLNEAKSICSKEEFLKLADELKIKEEV